MLQVQQNVLLTVKKQSSLLDFGISNHRYKTITVTKFGSITFHSFREMTLSA